VNERGGEKKMVQKNEKNAPQRKIVVRIHGGAKARLKKVRR